MLLLISTRGTILTCVESKEIEGYQRNFIVSHYKNGAEQCKANIFFFKDLFRFPGISGNF